jgi:hypothetical protein
MYVIASSNHCGSVIDRLFGATVKPIDLAPAQAVVDDARKRQLSAPSGTTSSRASSVTSIAC